MISRQKNTVADYADDLALLAKTAAQAESLLHNLKQPVRHISLYMNSDRTEFMYFNQDDTHLIKKQASEISWPVYIPWKQYLVYWKQRWCTYR